MFQMLPPATTSIDLCSIINFNSGMNDSNGNDSFIVDYLAVSYTWHYIKVKMQMRIKNC